MTTKEETQTKLTTENKRVQRFDQKYFQIEKSAMAQYKEYANSIREQMEKMQMLAMEEVQESEMSAVVPQREISEKQSQLDQLHEQNSLLQAKVDKSIETLSKMEEELRLSQIEQLEMEKQSEVALKKKKGDLQAEVSLISFRNIFFAHQDLFTLYLNITLCAIFQLDNRKACNKNLEDKLLVLKKFAEVQSKTESEINELQNRTELEQTNFDDEIKKQAQEIDSERRTLEQNEEGKLRETRRSIIAITEEKMIAKRKRTMVQSEQMRYELAYQTREAKKIESFMKNKEKSQRDIRKSILEKERMLKVDAKEIHEYKKEIEKLELAIKLKCSEKDVKDGDLKITDGEKLQAKKKAEDIKRELDEIRLKLMKHNELQKELKYLLDPSFGDECTILEAALSAANNLLSPFIRKNTAIDYASISANDIIARIQNEALEVATNINSISNEEGAQILETILKEVDRSIVRNSKVNCSNQQVDASISAYLALKSFDNESNRFSFVLPKTSLRESDD